MIWIRNEELQENSFEDIFINLRNVLTSRREVSVKLMPQSVWESTLKKFLSGYLTPSIKMALKLFLKKSKSTLEQRTKESQACLYLHWIDFLNEANSLVISNKNLSVGSEKRELFFKSVFDLLTTYKNPDLSAVYEKEIDKVTDQTFVDLENFLK